MPDGGVVAVVDLGLQCRKRVTAPTHAQVSEHQEGQRASLKGAGESVGNDKSKMTRLQEYVFACDSLEGAWELAMSMTRLRLPDYKNIYLSVTDQKEQGSWQCQ